MGLGVGYFADLLDFGFCVVGVICRLELGSWGLDWWMSWWFGLNWWIW